MKQTNSNKGRISISAFLRTPPQALARMHGNRNYPDIDGTVRFYKTPKGTFVIASIWGLPKGDDRCSGPVLAFHLHENGNCTGTSADFFADAGPHYNPYSCRHPYHRGDMPPLFSCGGQAFSAFLTDRFEIGDVVGRSCIIHSSPDDFSTQPSGNSGEKIACGKIRLWKSVT